MLAQNDINEKKPKKVEKINSPIYEYEIDFSLRNHVKDAFSNLIVTSIDSVLSCLVKCISYFCFGTLISLILFACFIIVTLAHKSIDVPFIKTIIQNQIEETTGTKNIEIKDTKLQYNTSDHIVLSIDGLRLENFFCPTINLAVNCIDSIKNTEINVDKIFLNNANFKAKMNNDLLNISFNNHKTPKKNSNKQKGVFIPYNKLISLLNLVDSKPKFEIKNSKCEFEFENNRFLLNDFYAFIGKADLYVPQKISFKTKLPDSKNFTNLVIKTNTTKNTNSRTFDIDISDLNITALNAILKQSKNQKINDISKILSQYNIDVSGHIKAIFTKNKLDTCMMNLKVGNGSIKSIFVDNELLKPWLMVKEGHVSIEFKNNCCYIKDLYGNINDSNVRISGLEIPIYSPDNKQIKFNGTLEIRNLSKNTLSLLPKEIAEACLFLFNKTVSKIMIDSLKLDLNGEINPNSPAKKNNIKVSHGILSTKNGEICIGNDTITGITAIGEVYKNSTKLKISNGNVGEISIKNGQLFVDNNIVWKGSLDIELPVHEFTKLNDDFAYLKNIIPEAVYANAKVSTTISIDTTQLPDITSSVKSCKKCKIVSTDNTILDVSKEKNVLIVKGNMPFEEFGMLDIDAKLDHKKNTGYKKILFQGKALALSKFYPFISCKSDSKIKLKISETYTGLSGQIETNLSIDNADIKLPFVGEANFDNATITAKANKIGNIVNYNDISIDNSGIKSKGYISYAEDTGEILGAKFTNLNFSNADFSMNYHKQGDKMQLSLIGKNADLSMLKSFIEKTPNNIDIMTSVNIENIKFNVFDSLKKLHGTFTIRDKCIVDAMAYAKLKGDTTVMIRTDTESKKLLTITASDAGTFLREFGLFNDVIGGKLVIRFAPQDNKSDIYKKIYCEITDVVIGNNKHISKLLSLTVPNITDVRNHSLGFNGIVCSMNIDDETIKIDNGRAIGPTICISFDGKYDKKTDLFDIRGIAAPVLVNNTNNMSIYSPYKITGGIGNIDIAVNPLNSSSHNILSDVFGMNLNRKDPEYINTQKADIEEPVIDLEEPVEHIEKPKSKTIRIDRHTNPHSKRKSRKTVTHGITVERLGAN